MCCRPSCFHITLYMKCIGICEIKYWKIRSNVGLWVTGHHHLNVHQRILWDQFSVRLAFKMFDKVMYELYFIEKKPSHTDGNKTNFTIWKPTSFKYQSFKQIWWIRCGLKSTACRWYNLWCFYWVWNLFFKTILCHFHFFLTRIWSKLIIPGT